MLGLTKQATSKQRASLLWLLLLLLLLWLSLLGCGIEQRSLRLCGSTNIGGRVSEQRPGGFSKGSNIQSDLPHAHLVDLIAHPKDILYTP